MRVPPLSPIHPSPPIRIKYQRELDKAIDRMQRSIVSELTKGYRENQPEVMVLYGMDASPAKILQGIMRSLTRQWQSEFDALAPKLSAYFATAVKDRCDRSLMADFRRAGLTVRFKMTAAMNDAYQAIISENVALIRSIPAQHLLGIESLVTQSVTAGRDLSVLSKGLQERYGVTKRRGANLALSQNNMATAALTRVRWLEMGVTQGIWRHSAGGKVPRPSHVAFSGSKYDVETGVVLDPKDGHILPGQLVNCRCVGVAVVSGYND